MFLILARQRGALAGFTAEKSTITHTCRQFQLLIPFLNSPAETIE
jgi:hypothetical protein